MTVRTLSEAMIDQMLADSFPASDPPAWTLGLDVQSGLNVAIASPNEAQHNESDSTKAGTTGPAVEERLIMTKAKLIKREEVVERQQAKAAQKVQKRAVRKTAEVVGDWIDNRRAQRIDPRAAFTALFALPQGN